jgi:hypothetical protein
LTTKRAIENRQAPWRILQRIVAGVFTWVSTRTRRQAGQKLPRTRQLVLFLRSTLRMGAMGGC